MANKTGLIIIVIIIAVGLYLAMPFKFKTTSFSILPLGQYNHNSDCSFLTNVVTDTTYATSGAWISVNDGSGIRGFGYAGSATYSCISTGAIMLTPKTPEGYDVCSRSGYPNRVYVDQGTISVFFESTAPAAGSAILSCNSSCTPNWQCTAWSTCSSGVQTRTCTDSNNCGVSTGRPSEVQACGSTAACLLNDSNSNNIVDDAELINVINRWINGN